MTARVGVLALQGDVREHVADRPAGQVGRGAGLVIGQRAEGGDQRRVRGTRTNKVTAHDVHSWSRYLRGPTSTRTKSKPLDVRTAMIMAPSSWGRTMSHTNPSGSAPIPTSWWFSNAIANWKVTPAVVLP